MPDIQTCMGCKCPKLQLNLLCHEICYEKQKLAPSFPKFLQQWELGQAQNSVKASHVDGTAASQHPH